VLLGEAITVNVDIEPKEDERLPAVQIETCYRKPLCCKTIRAAHRYYPCDRHLETTFDPTQPDAYQILVTGITPGFPVTPVIATVLVWPPMKIINHDHDFDWEANCISKGYEDYQVIRPHKDLELGHVDRQAKDSGAETALRTNNSL
jgi:hypothetical protein